MFNTIVGNGAVGAGTASRYGSGSDQKMRLLAAPAPQHCFFRQIVAVTWQFPLDDWYLNNNYNTSLKNRMKEISKQLH
jgi:hypothetical protein